MAKSKRPQHKRGGQSQPAGVSRAQTGQTAKISAASKADAAAQTDTADLVESAPVSAKSGARSGASGATDGSGNGNGAGGSPSKLSSIRERTGAASRTASAAVSAASAASARSSTRDGGRADRTASGLAKRAQPKRFARPPWWRRNLGGLITVSTIVVLIGGIVAYMYYQNGQAAAGIGDPVPSSVMTELTTVPSSVYQTVGTGSVSSAFTATQANTPLLLSNGKPEIVYVGAEYCPYCAAERWGTIIALSRFGSFSGLELMRSSSTDVYPNTPTFSFRNATYTSKYIVFNFTETQDRNQQALATPPADVLAYFTAYDSGGSIPFMSYGNQYYTVGGPFFPTMLANQNWQQVASQLKNPKSDVAQAIIGAANQQTAAICKITHNEPANVCSTPVIQQLESKLPAPK